MAEGCPRERAACGTMAHHAAPYGNSELVNWPPRERGFKMYERVMSGAAGSGNLELELRYFRGAAFGQREGGRKGGGRVLHFLPWLLYHGQARRVPPVHPPRLACVGRGRRGRGGQNGKN